VIQHIGATRPGQGGGESWRRKPRYTPGVRWFALGVQFSYLPALNALDALNKGDAARALEMTQVAAPYDLAVPATAYLAAFFGALYSVYVRGLAYSRIGRRGEAAVEFQKILDHPGIVLSDPIGPIARLQLARALSASAIAQSQPQSTRMSSRCGKTPTPTSPS
jgi:hypothetical protein